MTSSPAEIWDLFDQQERARPLGSLVAASNRILSPVSNGLRTAADNLLSKAASAVADGDQSRARRLAERALALPFDEHEQDHPGWTQASFLLFSAVTDALEDCDEDDSFWLDAAEQVLRQCRAPGAPALQGCLATVAEDFEVSPREAGRCRRAAAGLGPGAWEQAEPDDPAERLDAVLAVLEALVAYEDLVFTDD